MRTTWVSGGYAAKRPLRLRRSHSRVAPLRLGGVRKQPACHGELAGFDTGMFGCHRRPIDMFGTMQGIRNHESDNDSQAGQGE
jgi:hypothetical protein